MPHPGVREGVRVGTGQRNSNTQHLYWRERDIEMEDEEKKEEKWREKRSSSWHNLVGKIYIFITLSRTIFILDQKEMGKEETCRQGLGALREVFLLFFLFGACKYVCATWASHCRSKLNTEFSLFYSFFFITWLFVEKEPWTVSSLQSSCMVLICG